MKRTLWLSTAVVVCAHLADGAGPCTLGLVQAIVLFHNQQKFELFYTIKEKLLFCTKEMSFTSTQITYQ